MGVLPPARTELPKRNETRSPSVGFVATSYATVDLLLGKNTGHVGGAELQQVLLAQSLKTRGWRVVFLIADETGDRGSYGTNEFEIIVAFGRGGLPGLRFCFHKLPGLWRAMRKANCDVYVTRGRSWLVGAAAIYAKMRHRGSVYWSASAPDVRRKRWPWRAYFGLPAILERYGVAHAHLMVTQSEEQRVTAQHELHRDSVVIPNLVASETTRWTGGSGVLWVGEMRPIKRPWVCLEVAQLLPDVPFRMIGGSDESDPSLLERVKNSAKNLPNVSVVGHVPFEKVGAYFDQSDLLLCTSESEGFPNTFLQAWNRGVPVVSTVDPNRTIERFGLGRVGADPADLAEHIAALMRDSGTRLAIGERARDYVYKHHHPDIVVPKLEAALLDLIHRVSGSVGP